ncbi:hypothetical protein BDV30DRAFT_231031 [Aspergillus minisclerotigenes]|uniref:Major facilitator superfamily (MFS) profile domain-containing protein n=1 Tax=Aspergillus minisclerotigenes TaxID=656917 RepID=A0A5N6IQA6_9EURO|nr:hypothetical protein BDV30DRAFT_231031 [Aspergillus minisclerotigenes]
MFLRSGLKEQLLYQDLNIRLLCVFLISSLGATGFGFDNGWWGSISGLSEFQKKYGAYNDSKQAGETPGQTMSVAAGTGSAGIIFGCLLAPTLTSKLGRQPTFLIMSIIKTMCITLEVTAMKSFWQLVVGRIFIYYAIGISSNVVPMYQSEFAPATVRGAFLALHSFLTSFGQFMATLAYFVSMGYICLYFLIPDSPRYLVYRGKYREAKDVMSRLYNREFVADEVESFKQQIETQLEMHKATGLLDCFRTTKIWRTIPAIGVQVFQQAHGVSFIQNYAVSFIQRLGFHDTRRTAIMVIGRGFRVHVITFLTFDKMGRRNTILTGALGLAAMMIGVGITTSVPTETFTAAAQNAFVAILILWYCIFGFTWGPGAWVVYADIGTAQLRERTVFPATIGRSSGGGAVTFIYGAFSLVGLVFVFFMMPESKNRSLEDLDGMFQKPSPGQGFRILYHFRTGS